MASRIDVLKTYKLFIDGAFPRSESGRSFPVTDSSDRVVAHVSWASRKDVRDAVEAARRAFDRWAGAAAYNRAQVMYRMAEMMEGKRAELAGAIRSVPASRRGGKTPEEEVQRAVDRLVYYAGWADKYSQVLGCNNPVSGPYYNFTIAEPTGVVAVIAPDECPLLSLVSLIAPVLCSGNTVVAVAGEFNPIPGAVFGEVCATSDVPAGAINVLTARRSELLNVISTHRDIDGVHAQGLSPEECALLRAGAGENVKRVVAVPAGPGQRDWFGDRHESPYCIEPFVEMKTVWHPASA